MNAITDCAKRGTSLENSIIYITHYPCIHCFKTIASCGIKEICYLHDYKNDELVSVLASEAKITIRRFFI
jgi:dCMP deaminase